MQNSMGYGLVRDAPTILMQGAPPGLLVHACRGIWLVGPAARVPRDGWGRG